LPDVGGEGKPKALAKVSGDDSEEGGAQTRKRAGRRAADAAPELDEDSGGAGPGTLEAEERGDAQLRKYMLEMLMMPVRSPPVEKKVLTRCVVGWGRCRVLIARAWQMQFAAEYNDAAITQAQFFAQRPFDYAGATTWVTVLGHFARLEEAQEFIRATMAVGALPRLWKLLFLDSSE
jgi:hypothetical protein